MFNKDREEEIANRLNQLEKHEQEQPMQQFPQPNQKEKSVSHYIDSAKNVGIFLIYAILVWALVVSGYNAIISPITDLVGSYLPTTLAWAAQIIVILTLLAVIIFPFPFAAIETKKKVFFTIATILGIIYIAFFVINLFALSPEAEQNRDVVSEQTGNAWTNFWDDINCRIQGKTVCNLQKENTQQTEQSTRTENFKLSLNKYTTNTYTYQDIERGVPISLSYDITTPTPITINSIECYYDSVKPENKFDAINFETPIQLESGLTDSYLCQIDKNMLSQKLSKTAQIINIWAVLTYEYENTLSIEIPIVNYAQYSSSYKTQAQIRDEYKKENGEPTTKNTPAIPHITIKNLPSKLPLILGDSQTEQLPIAINIDMNSAASTKSSFGEITKSTITQINEISSIKIEDINQYIGKEFLPLNSEATLSIPAVENENQNFEEREAIQTFNIKLKTSFRKNDYLPIQFSMTNEEIEMLKNNQNNVTTTPELS